MFGKLSWRAGRPPPITATLILCYFCFGLIDESLEGSRIVNGKLSQYFPVQVDAGFLESIDKAGVIDSLLRYRGADAHNPQ